jgi:gamma-glutamylcyclotransferase (GGCT)/AIG2-like uncharacterized protein YtfP
MSKPSRLLALNLLAQSTPHGSLDPRPVAPRYVFVYGTLRRGGSNDITRFEPAPRFVSKAKVEGVMYDLGPYPGVLLGGACWVQGEVYEISAALERQLDIIEEIWPEPSGEYVKRELLVRLDGSSAVLGAESQSALVCAVYEINPERIVGRSSIPGGDWITSTIAP